MTATVIVPTMVQIRKIPTTIIYGATERRLMKLNFEAPKTYQNDWVLLSTYLSSAECANVFSIHLNVDTRVADTATNVLAVDTFTYTSADGKVVASGTTTGTVLGEMIYWTE